MAKYRFLHDESTANKRSRMSAIKEAQKKYSYDNDFGKLGLRGIQDLNQDDQLSPLQGLALIAHTTQVNANKQRGIDQWIDKVPANQEIYANNSIIRNITRSEEIEDTLYKLPPTEEMIEAIRCMQEATTQVPCVTDTLPPLSVHEYLKLYTDNENVPTPRHSGKALFSDEAFAAMALAGCNPLLIENIDLNRLDKICEDGFNVKSSDLNLFQEGSPFTKNGDDNLEALAASGKLYYEEYSELETLRPNAGKIAPLPIPNGKQTRPTREEKRFVFAPKVLYGVTKIRGKATLMPIAIQCREIKPNGRIDNGPIFYPHTKNAVTYEKDMNLENADYTWQIAKSIVLSANANHHESISHLGKTHLLMESIFLALRRNVSREHPVHGLLRPHYLGTFFINESARSLLISDGGDVEQYLGGTLKSFKETTAKAIKTLRIEDDYLEARLLKKKVHPSKSENPLPSYPYAEDALLLWDAYRDFVKGFLRIYYKNDFDFNKDVKIDGELKNFFSDLINSQITVDGHVLGGLNVTPPRTFDDLVEFLTWVIFTVTSHHSAVNYSQADILSNPAWQPTAIYKPAPKSFGASRGDYLESLPPYFKAIGQVSVGYQLGGLFYAPITGLSTSDYLNISYTDYNPIRNILSRIGKRIGKIEETISKRNSLRSKHLRYYYLLPSRTSRSINI